MTSGEFNQKYFHLLDEGHYGLDINDPDIAIFLDSLFPGIAMLYPTMKYQQIKLKFGMARFYMVNVPQEVTTEIEHEINKINDNSSTHTR